MGVRTCFIQVYGTTVHTVDVAAIHDKKEQG